MAKNAAFMIFSIYLIHLISALPHYQKFDDKKILETFEEANKFLSYVESVPKEDHKAVVNAFNVQSGLFENIFSEADDELILSCIVKYKEDYVNALNNSHNGAKKCIRNAQEEAFTIALEIHNIKEKINDHIENLKTVIDDCLEKNSAADVTLQCISDTTVYNVQGISNGIQDIKSALVGGWAEVKKIAEETKECLNATAEKGSEDITALIQNVSNCIDSKP